MSEKTCSVDIPKKAILKVVDTIRRLANEMNTTTNPMRDKCGQIESETMLLYDWLNLLTKEEMKGLAWRVR